jgi:CheY-like chemotaxis protein
VENLSFLIVDENSRMVSILKVLLRAFGVRQIEECYDGAKAGDAFQASRPDIVAMSGNLSGVPSLELVHRFRDFRNSPDPFIPIIFISTHTDSARLRKARDAGVTEIVRKPVNALDFYRAIDSVIHQPRPFVNVPGYFGPCRRRKDIAYQGEDRRYMDTARAAEAFPPFAPLPQPAAIVSASTGDVFSSVQLARMPLLKPANSPLEAAAAE